MSFGATTPEKVCHKSYKPGEKETAVNGTTMSHDDEENDNDNDNEEIVATSEETETSQPTQAPVTVEPTYEPTSGEPTYLPTISRIYDVHGCCLSCGQIYCSGSHTCINAGSTCASMGSYNVNDDQCSFTYSTGTTSSSYSFTYDLAPYMLSGLEYYQVSYFTPALMMLYSFNIM